jgi:hypothetical protein
MHLRSPPRHQRHDGYTSRSALLWNTDHGPGMNEHTPRRVTDPPDTSQPPGMLGTLTMGWIWRVTRRENKGTRARWGGPNDTLFGPPGTFFLLLCFVLSTNSVFSFCSCHPHLLTTPTTMSHCLWGGRSPMSPPTRRHPCLRATARRVDLFYSG